MNRSVSGVQYVPVLIGMGQHSMHRFYQDVEMLHHQDKGNFSIDGKAAEVVVEEGAL